MARRVVESLSSKVAGAGGLVSISITREEHFALSEILDDFVRGASDDKLAIYDAVAISFAQGRLKGLEEAALSVCPLCNTRSWHGVDGSLYHYSEEESRSSLCKAPEIRSLIDSGGKRG
jgi:hypothetical protein